MTRKRRARLKGWWAYLPFVLVPFALLFSEVWYQTQILNNEYKQNALRSSIRQSELSLELLDDEIRELARMERVLERAPDLGLGLPNPGQVIEIGKQEHRAAAQGPEVNIVPVLAASLQGPAVRNAPKPNPADSKLVAKPSELEPLEPLDEWTE